MDSQKIKLGDLLVAFEDAFNAGWDARNTMERNDKASAFSKWLDEEIKRLGLG